MQPGWDGVVPVLASGCPPKMQEFGAGAGSLSRRTSSCSSSTHGRRSPHRRDFHLESRQARRFRGADRRNIAPDSCIPWRAEYSRSARAVAMIHSAGATSGFQTSMGYPPCLLWATTFWGRGPKTRGGAPFRTCSGGAGAKPPTTKDLEDTERSYRSVSSRWR
jgi:hypothetical protein